MSCWYPCDPSHGKCRLQAVPEHQSEIKYIKNYQMFSNFQHKQIQTISLQISPIEMYANPWILEVGGGVLVSRTQPIHLIKYIKFDIICYFY